MKKIFILIFSLFLISSVKVAYPQAGSITIGLIGTECDQIIVQWNSTFAFVGTGNNQWIQSTVTITWPETATTDQNTLGTIIPIVPGFTGWQYDGLAQLSGGTEWRRKLILLSGGYTQDIPVGITEIVAIKINGVAPNTSTFTIANPFSNTNISSFNFAGEMWSGTFNPATTPAVPFADAVRWNGTRWCGGRSTVYFGQPSSADQTINCFITGPNGVLNEVDARVAQLTVNAASNLTVAPGASFTTYGTINVNGVNGLNIDANTTTTGSFISRGATFNYGTGASSFVKQYFVDNVTSVPFHVHLVGPLLNDPAFQTATTFRGVYLSAFNLANNFTYAYTYDNTLAGSEWVNQSDVNYPVYATMGIALSTTTNTNYFLNMTGKLVHGTITSANGPSAVNDGFNLFSNPYPSGISCDAFLSLNFIDNAVCSDEVFAWEGANTVDGGNYVYWNYTDQLGTGGLTGGVIPMGQGFFLDSYPSVGNVTFNLGMRTHSSTILLKDGPTNMLRLFARGNDFKDESVILFREFGTPGNGMGDTEKWPSMYETATESWTVSADNVNLAINALPSLGTEMVSVPLSFKCGIEGTYTIEAAEIESFDAGTEIYLEDLKLGGEWYDLMANPVYEFTGSPADLQERFVLHFFGPTAIDDPDGDGSMANAVQIYSWGQDAYIVNRGKETVKEYVAYDLMGRELHRGTLPNSTVNKVQIGDVSAYYIVKVITKEGRIYTDKVYITK